MSNRFHKPFLRYFNSAFQIRNGLFIFFVSLLMLFAGCKKKCDQCLNDGLCNAKNKCECKPQYFGEHCQTACTVGYEGDTCGTLSKLKFIGTYDCTTNGSDGSNVTHLMQVSDETYYAYVKFSNIANQAFSLRGTISATNKMEFMQQNAVGSYTGVVDGSAVIKDDELTVNIRKAGIDYFTKGKRL